MTEHEFTIRQDPATGGWSIQSAAGVRRGAETHTQQEALDAARDLIPVGANGRVRIVGAYAGSTSRIVRVNGRGTPLPAAARPDPAPPAAAAPPPHPAQPEPLTLTDAAEGMGAAAARLRGESFDPDGDGQAEGDAVLDALLQRGPDTQSKRVFTAARGWMDVVIMLLSFFGALIGVPLVAPWIQGGVVGVALSTLALSGGAFLAGVVFLSKQVDMETRSGATWAAVILAASFLVSTGVAATLGQPAPALESPQFTATIQRAFTLGGPLDFRIVTAALAALGYVLFGSAQIYGWGGAFLSIVCGLLIAWRAVDLWAGVKGVPTS